MTRAPTSPQPAPQARLALAVAALGVVFGDIGTSPIYTVQTVFNPDDPHPIAATEASVLGIVSLIVWSVTIVVTVKYVLLVMRADNDGEGGILALITLIRRAGTAPKRHRTAVILAALGVFGASLFFGDSMITPAISVLSAVEGVEVVQPSLHDAVIPITIVIIVMLFASQRLGSSRVGSLFGPVMVVWFVTVAACGINGIRRDPAVLRALSPTYAVGYFFGHFPASFFSLAAVVLAITGAEALYADMGHFGRSPITRAWLMLVFPALVLSYLGQGALVEKEPQAISSPFFLLVPHWGQVPLVILATMATVIASQSVISGAFSLTHQAIQLGYLPRLRVRHTSAEASGQIYVPWINWALLVAVVSLVLAFRSSTGLAFAYGMAVTTTITITTLLYFYVVRIRWQRPLWVVVLAAAGFLVVDLLFFTANLTKLVHGAWLPLLIGLAVFVVMTTWQRGRELISARRRHDEGSLPDFVEDLHAGRIPVTRVPGTAVFLNRGKETAPLALRANVEHNHVLHQQVLILSVETAPKPHVAPRHRLQVDHLGHQDDGITHITAFFGYMESPSVPRILTAAKKRLGEGPVDLKQATYFLSTVSIYLGPESEMVRWRQRLFLATSRLTTDAADYFGLPRDRTVIMGSRIQL